MAFSFKETMKNALIQAIGKKPDFEIILAAGEWIKLGKMTESDLADIQAAIDAQYVIEEEYDALQTAESEVREM